MNFSMGCTCVYVWIYVKDIVCICMSLCVYEKLSGLAPSEIKISIYFYYRDIESGASYPSVNLVIPLATVWPVLKHYINRKGNVSSA